MTKIVLSIYNYLSKHRAVRWTSMIVSTILFVVLGVQIHFEEDITKLLPSTGDSSETLAFSQLKVKDKIFVLVTSKDEANPLSADELIEISDELTNNLMERDSSNNDIADILSQVDEMMMLDVVTYLADNFPVFVDTSSYGKIESLLSQSSINKNVAATKGMLTTQAGIAMKDMLAADPIGMRNVVIEKVKDIKEGLGNSQIVYEGHLFTPDTTVALSYISPNFKSFDSGSGRRLVNLIEDEIKQCEINHPDCEILFHGVQCRASTIAAR